MIDSQKVSNLIAAAQEVVKNRYGHSPSESDLTILENALEAMGLRPLDPIEILASTKKD